MTEQEQTPGELVLSLANGTHVTVAAVHIGQYLTIHKAPDASLEDDRKPWRISHRPTGCLFAADIRHKADAVLGAARFEQLATACGMDLGIDDADRFTTDRAFPEFARAAMKLRRELRQIEG